MVAEGVTVLIEVEGLVKRYGYVKAVSGVSFRISEGEVVGLVGPNGAGKSTTIKSIVGLVRPDAGRIAVDSRDPLREPSVRRLLGYIPEAPEGPGWATVCEFLEDAALIDGYSAAEARMVSRRVLDMLGLSQVCGRKLKTLSKGQRKRIMIAQALLAERRYYLMDEPFTGLDPEWVARLRDLIVKLSREDGAGVLVSSHILRELQDIVDRVVVISRGKLVFEGTLRELAEKVGLGAYIIIRTRMAARAARVLEEAGIKGVTVYAGSIRIDVGDEVEPTALVDLLRRAGVEIEGFEYRRASLEEAYLKLVGETGI